MAELLAALLITAGLVFFLAGNLGLLRFPDLYSRLHALTKADNVGLGLLVAGLLVLPGSGLGAKSLLVWLLILWASASAAHLIARHARRREGSPWNS